MKITPVKKKTLVRHNLTVTELAQRIDRRRDEVGNVLNGQRFTPHIQEAVAKYFESTVEELFGRWAWTKRYRKSRRLAKRRNNPKTNGRGDGKERKR